MSNAASPIPQYNLKQSLILALAGFTGAASFWFSELPIPAEYQGLISPEAFRVQTMVGPMLLVSSALLAGHFTTRKAGLKTPVLSALLSRGDVIRPLGRQLIAGFAGAAVLMTVLMSLKPIMHDTVPPEQINALHSFESNNLHFATRFVYGVFSEEIVMRWGVFGAVAFVMTKLIPAASKRPAALLAAAFFAASIATAIHAPTLHHVIDKPAQELVLYSSGIGLLTSLIACELFIWRGLGAAMSFKAFSICALTLYPSIAY